MATGPNQNTFRVLEGGFAGASVLISFGVILGKTNPLQLLVTALIQTILYVTNSLIGTNLLSAIDIGNSNTSGCYGVTNAIGTLIPPNRMQVSGSN